MLLICFLYVSYLHHPYCPTIHTADNMDTIRPHTGVVGSFELGALRQDVMGMHTLGSMDTLPSQDFIGCFEAKVLEGMHPQLV